LRSCFAPAAPLLSRLTLAAKALRELRQMPHSFYWLIRWKWPGRDRTIRLVILLPAACSFSLRLTPDVGFAPTSFPGTGARCLAVFDRKLKLLLLG
jgi:hypothetical protein